MKINWPYHKSKKVKQICTHELHYLSTRYVIFFALFSAMNFIIIINLFLLKKMWIHTKKSPQAFKYFCVLMWFKVQFLDDFYIRSNYKISKRVAKKPKENLEQIEEKQTIKGKRRIKNKLNSGFVVALYPNTIW